MTISNIIMIASLRFLRKQKSVTAPWIVFALASVGFTASARWVFDVRPAVGYWVWVTSFALLLLGLVTRRCLMNAAGSLASIT
jgi:hypothetical protein